MAIIRDEFYVNFRGKQHPTWPGVLVALHENGVLGIEVTVLQYPSPENGQTAVCQATVTMPGKDGRELLFSEVGDANPTNVGSQIVPHIIRMAATRSKGRAGRDALALGIALFEELGPDSDPQEGHNGHQRPQQIQRARHDPADEADRKAAQAAPGVCDICGAAVEAKVAEAAVRKFRRVLCIDDGKAEVARLKEVAATASQGA